MNANKKLTISHCIMVSGILIAASAMFINGNDTIVYLLVGAGIVLEIIGFIYAILFVRCPFCHRQLPLIGIGVDYCPHCGEKIEE